MTWPTDGVDAAVTRSNGEVCDADDFNDQDTQIRGLQTWLGDGDGELIGDDSNPAHGPGGLASPVADGGDAITLASKSTYTSGNLISVVNGRDQNPLEVLTVDSAGYIDAEGLSVDADGVLASPGSRNEIQTVTSNSNAVAVDCQDGFTVYHELTENTTIGEPSNAEDGMRLLFIVEQSEGNSYTLQWNAAFEWDGAFAPGEPSAGDKRMFEFVRYGGKWNELLRSGTGDLAVD